MKFLTKAIHVGNEPESNFGAITPPIYMTSTFLQDAPGELKNNYEYTRGNNPNFTMLEEQLASLEEGKYSTVFSSGLGALTAMVSTLSPGDQILALDGLYGGTYRLLTGIFQKFGIKFTSIPLSEVSNIEQHFNKINPKWLFFETPTNPLLDLYDIGALTKAARKRNIKSFVDNTFSSPYFQNPLLLEADVVWHSTTKYISGHSDVVGGVVITNDKAFNEEIHFNRMAMGLNPSPFDAWLTLRGVKTLGLRMEQHQKNALAIAQYLEKHPLVKRVIFPGLPSNPYHELSKKQMSGYGGIVSAEFKLPIEQVKKLIASFKLFALAESLGGVESLVNHPALMTHASIPPEERKRIGLSDNLIRFSVGIEETEDLIEDLSTALESLSLTART